MQQRQAFNSRSAHTFTLLLLTALFSGREREMTAKFHSILTIMVIAGVAAIPMSLSAAPSKNKLNIVELKNANAKKRKKTANKKKLKKKAIGKPAKPASLGKKKAKVSSSAKARKTETKETKLFDLLKVSKRANKGKKKKYAWENAYMFAVASQFAYEPEKRPMMKTKNKRMGPKHAARDRYAKIGLQFCEKDQSIQYRGPIPRKVRDYRVNVVTGKRMKSKKKSSHRTDTQYYLLYNEDAVVLVFRGSEGSPGDALGSQINPMKQTKAEIDWLQTDANLWPANPYDTKKKEVGRVSQGFYFAWAAPRIEDRLVKRIKNCMKREEPQGPSRKSRRFQRHLFIAGHSLGGAVAQVAAFDLMTSFDIKVRGVYSYGNPRWAGKKLAKNYNRKLGAQTHRWVNKNDMVTGIPPAAAHSHVGRLHRLRIVKKKNKKGEKLIASLDYNSQKTGTELLQGSRLRQPATRPSKGWTLVVRYMGEEREPEAFEPGSNKARTLTPSETTLHLRQKSRPRRRIIP